MTKKKDNLSIKRAAPKIKMGAEAQKVFAGELFSVYQWPQKMFDGSTATFEMLKRADTVTMIPVTSDKKIIMTRQEQPGQEVFYSLPGGIIDPGEEVLTAAKRELMEETGHFSDDWSFLFSNQPTGKIDWASFMFLAKDCQQDNPPNPDAGEKIELELVSFDRFVEIMRREDFRNHDIALKYFRMSEEERAAFKKLLIS